MKSLITRSLSGFVYATVLLVAVLYSPITSGLLFLVLMLFSIYEFQKMTASKSLITYFSGTFFFVSIFFPDYQWEFVFGALLLAFLGFLPLLRKNNKLSPTKHLGTMSLTLLYIVVPFSHSCSIFTSCTNTLFFDK